MAGNYAVLAVLLLFLVFDLIYITSVLLGMLLIQHSYNCCIFTLCMQGNFVAFFILYERVTVRRPGSLGFNIIWAQMRETLTLLLANIKDADQPAHPHRLISASVIHYLKSHIFHNSQFFLVGFNMIKSLATPLLSANFCQNHHFQKRIIQEYNRVSNSLDLDQD